MLKVNALMKKNINKFYFLKPFLNSQAFIAPVAVLIWQAAGVSLSMATLLLSFHSILAVILEVPSGYLADIWGRKKSLILSAFFFILGAIAFALSKNFFHFLIAEFFLAAAASFASGADSAFVFDSLKSQKKEKKFHKIWGKIIFYTLIFAAFATFLGGLLADFNLQYSIYISIVFFTIALIISFTLKEPKVYKQIIKKDYLKNLIKILKNLIKENRLIFYIMLYSGLIFSLNQMIFFMSQSYFDKIGLDPFYFGLIFALANIYTAFIAKYSHTIEQKFSLKKVLFSLFILTALSYFLMGLISIFLSFIFIIFQQTSRGFQQVLFNDYINKRTASYKRATILSAKSFLERLIYAVIFPLIGLYNHYFKLNNTFILCGILTVIFGLILTRLINRKSK